MKLRALELFTLPFVFVLSIAVLDSQRAYSQSAQPNPAQQRGAQGLQDYVPCGFQGEPKDIARELYRQTLATAKSGYREQAPKDAIARLEQTLSQMSEPSIGELTAKVSSEQSLTLEQQNSLTKDLTNSYSVSLAAPKDVGCSASIMDWRETSDIFGRRIADTYIAIQVNVRNVNVDNEFLLHDIQIAMDDAPGVLGRDKALVRGVAERGQSQDPRNFAVRVAEALASLAGASSVAFTGVDFKNGVNIFQSAFVPGLKNVFPDYTIAQLNRLNDMAFSSSSSSAVVVPKNGSVPLVTFLSQKVFAAQRSGNSGQYLKFRNWSSGELWDFQNKAVVMVAGIHVKEMKTEDPSLTQMNCTESSAKYTCALAGENLHLVSTLRFKNSTDPSDKLDGTVSVTGNPQKATVEFQEADLTKLKGQEYTVYLVKSDGTEIKTNFTNSFPKTN